MIRGTTWTTRAPVLSLETSSITCQHKVLTETPPTRISPTILSKIALRPSRKTWQHVLSRCKTSSKRKTTVMKKMKCPIPMPIMRPKPRGDKRKLIRNFSHKYLHFLPLPKRLSLYVKHPRPNLHPRKACQGAKSKPQTRTVEPSCCSRQN